MLSFVIYCINSQNHKEPVPKYFSVANDKVVAGNCNVASYRSPSTWAPFLGLIWPPRASQSPPGALQPSAAESHMHWFSRGLLIMELARGRRGKEEHVGIWVCAAAATQGGQSLLLAAAPGSRLSLGGLVGTWLLPASLNPLFPSYFFPLQTFWFSFSLNFLL